MASCAGADEGLEEELTSIRFRIEVFRCVTTPSFRIVDNETFALLLKVQGVIAVTTPQRIGGRRNSVSYQASFEIGSIHFVSIAYSSWPHEVAIARMRSALRSGAVSSLARSIQTRQIAGSWLSPPLLELACSFGMALALCE